MDTNQKRLRRWNGASVANRSSHAPIRGIEIWLITTETSSAAEGTKSNVNVRPSVLKPGQMPERHECRASGASLRRYSAVSLGRI